MLVCCCMYMLFARMANKFEKAAGGQVLHYPLAFNITILTSNHHKVQRVRKIMPQNKRSFF